MQTLLIKNGTIINRSKSFEGDIFIKGNRIELIAPNINKEADRVIDAGGMMVMPGIIDDQVHFREPGMEYKANIYTESRAAIAGGVTSFMEMPNTKPAVLTQQLLQNKYDIASKSSMANYSFFMGVSNDNLEEVLKTNKKDVCGIKVFMGSSTGNMLVDNLKVLENLFSKSEMLIATHCEDEQTIKDNLQAAKEKYGNNVPVEMHPIIRNADACYMSSSFAVEIAKKHNTRLHILHISTAKELALFDNTIPLNNKRITSEVCVHHMYFNADLYPTLGNRIKCNPAIKFKSDQEAIFEALLDDRLDIIATDHAPHTWEEKSNDYLNAPAGLPLVQHSINLMLTFYQKGKISMEKIVEKMCHAPAECFNIVDRGYLDEGKFADVVILDPKEKWTIQKDNILHKCNWSPLEGNEMQGKVKYTIVNGKVAYEKNKVVDSNFGERMTFDRH